jgi:hypothetical protein
VRRLLVVACFAVALWAAPGALASGWCGSGENTADLPDANTGPQFHAVYAIPADGVDRFAATANQLADDITSIDGWWTGQDPTRTLRFDTAQFPTCVGVDISFVRLSIPAAQVGVSPSDFDTVAAGLESAGFGIGTPNDTFKNYLVYYDGPPPDAGICGTGAGDFDLGEGLAIVWLNACPRAPTDAVAAHEALHALGALPLGAPHACPAGQGGTGHPCDNPLDVLYPYASGAPLVQQFLDWNHDDYYAHSGPWPDIQDSVFLYRLDVQQTPLVVNVAGGGTVTSDQPGLACSASRTTQWDPAATLNLTATPAAGMRFVGWSGACTGATVCRLTLSAAQTVTATFGPATIAVRVSVTGRGRVACTPACSTAFAAGTPLQLRAVPAKGWRFAGWSGTCKSKAVTCAPATGAAVATRATFTKIPVKPKPKTKAKAKGQ